MTWFRERLHDSAKQALEISKTIYRGESAFQTIEVFENAHFGRVLVLDGIVQTTERDEFIYHEMLTHVPALGHGHVSRALIIGGGDGGMLEELLKHGVEAVTMVEIDQNVVDVCREHLGGICGGAFEDPRTMLVIGDGAEFVADAADAFDLIIVDSPDPIGPATALFERPFYENCRRALAESGLIAAQTGVPFFQPEEVVGCHRLFAELFAHSGFFLAPVPAYYGGAMAFGWASDALELAKPERKTIAARCAAAELATGYYNPEVHCAAFALPNYIRELASLSPER